MVGQPSRPELQLLLTTPSGPSPEHLIEPRELNESYFDGFAPGVAAERVRPRVRRRITMVVASHAAARIHTATRTVGTAVA